MKRFFLLLFNFAAKVLGSLLLLALFIMVYLHTDDGRELIRVRVEKKLSELLSQPLTIKKIRLDSLHCLYMHGIDVLLPSGVYMHIEWVCLRGDVLAPFFSGDLAFDMKGIKLPRLPTLEATVDAHFLKNALELKATVSESLTSVPLAVLDAKLPLAKWGGMPCAIDLAAPMHTHMTATLPLAPLVNPFVSETLFIDGLLQVSIALSGSVTEPSLTGRGSLSNGTCESLVSGALYQSIESQFQISGSTLEIETFIARGGVDAGTITGKGTVDLKHDLPFHFDVHLHSAALLHCDLAEGIFSGPLTCQGNRFQTTLKGNVDCERLEIFLPEHHPKETYAVEVVYINQTDAGPPPTKSRRSTEKSSLCYDLHVRSLKGISIQGNGLKSLWKGDLAIVGPANAPLLDGEWRLSSGEYLFNGKKWDLSQGTISLKGEEGKKTSLYAVAQQSSDISIEVIVKGALGDLSLVFRSSPQMTQKEILCHILFGCGLREITPFQGAELAKSINKLQQASSFEGLDILSKIRNTFSFIDRVDLVQQGGEQGGDVSLKVGSYVLPHLFVGVKKNLMSNVNGIEIEADLLRHVKLQAEFGDDRDKQIHLKWKRDY